MALPRATQTGDAAAWPAERFFQFSLLGLLASGYGAMLGSGYLDAPTAVLTGGALVWRACIIAGLVPGLPSSWLTPLTLAYMVFYPLDWKFLSGEFLPATVRLVFFLAAVKILSARSDRDYLYVQVIAFLTLLSASIVSARLNYFFFLALFLLFAVATLTSGEIRRSAADSRTVARFSTRIFPWKLAATALLISVCILLLTGGLFYLLPRTARAAFRHLVPERYHLPALATEVSLGEIGQYKRQSAVLMHARIYNESRPLHLKWRAGALVRFDGKRWYNPTRRGSPLRVEKGLLRLASDDQRRRQGERISYEVRLKPYASDSLLIAGRAEFIRIDRPMLLELPAGGYGLGYRPVDPLRYGVYSFLGSAAEGQSQPVMAGEDAKAAYLQLPPVDPRVVELTSRLTTELAGAHAKAEAIEAHLRGSYGYTLELPEEEAADPIAHFLFERRRGHCEYYASAMAVMLRIAGIPSRVATGFQSGSYNPLSEWYVIRASDAHSWVEAFVPGSGWTVFDPTPPDPSAQATSLWARVTLLVDAAETFWQEWVLGYDLERQLILAARVEQSRRSWSTGWAMTLRSQWSGWRKEASAWIAAHGWSALLGVVSLAALLLVLRMLSRWWSVRRGLSRARCGIASDSDAALLYRRALNHMQARGFVRVPSQTPLEFARSLPASESSAVFAELTTAYNDVRFGARTNAAQQLAHLLERLERPEST